MRDWRKSTFGFFGGGAIAEVFARRLIEGAFVKSDGVLVYDIDSAKLGRLTSSLGIRPMTSNRAVAQAAEVIFVAVPPIDTVPVLRDVGPALGQHALVVSLAAAVPIVALEDAIGKSIALVRVVPNIPSWIGQGVNLVCFGQHLRLDEQRATLELLATFGDAIEIPEDQMAIATALTAVGPTYILPIVQALVEAGTSRGFPQDSAVAAVCQLVAGTARLVKETGRTPTELGHFVGIHTLDEAATRKIFEAAVDAAFGKIRAAESRVAAVAGAS